MDEQVFSPSDTKDHRKYFLQVLDLALTAPLPSLLNTSILPCGFPCSTDGCSDWIFYPQKVERVH